MGVSDFAYNCHQIISIIIDREKKLLEQCHELYKSHSIFVLPSSGGVSVQDCFSNVINWLRNRIHPDFRKVFKVPSSLGKFICDLCTYCNLWCNTHHFLTLLNLPYLYSVIRLLWEKFSKIHVDSSNPTTKIESHSVQKISSSISLAKSSTNKILSTDVTFSISRLLTISLETEVDLFVAFIKEVIETQLVLEFLSFSHGYLDGL